MIYNNKKQIVCMYLNIGLLILYLARKKKC